MSEIGLIWVAGALAVFSAFMAVTSVRGQLRIERIARESIEREKELFKLADRRHRAYWTSPTTWIDPDCFECGGAGAPCCDPPTYPYRKDREGVDFGGDGWTTPLDEPFQHRPVERAQRPTADRLWKALDDMTGQFPVIKPEDRYPH